MPRNSKGKDWYPGKRFMDLFASKPKRPASKRKKGVTAKGTAPPGSPSGPALPSPTPVHAPPVHDADDSSSASPPGGGQ